MKRFCAMLKTIQCDQFIEKGRVRPPITFKRGLNTILGDEVATNSIGKSTFLMILDFVYGGDDYIRRSIDVHHHIGPHTINFAFEFEDGLHYFSRATDDPNTINICDESYQSIKAIPKDRYTKLLSAKFKLDLPGLTLRNAIGRFFRIHGRETLDAKHPLQAAAKEPRKDGIDALLKLFGHYETIKNQMTLAEIAEQEEKMFKGAQKYNYLPSVTTQEQYKKNEKRMIELEKEIQRLTKDSTEGFATLETIHTESLAELHQQLQTEKRHFISLTSELDSMENAETKKSTLQKDSEKLQQFFPSINMKKLEDIEDFHRKISEFLRSEFKEKKANLQSILDLSSQRISQLELQVTELGNTPNVTHAILNRYSEKQQELYRLQAGNQAYETKIRLKQKTKELKDLLNTITLQLNQATESEINAVMNELNELINGKKMAPHLNIEDSTRYHFSTPNDHGTGSQHKGLILFDLAILKTTSLPLLVHDSVLLKQIEDGTLEDLLHLYSQTHKQIFITFDKKKSCTKKAQEILRTTEVLHLYPNGGELFGHAWNISN